jgi:phosphohistidine phosphatase
MKLLIVRHAIALDRGTPGVSDHLRPLTEEGVSRFKKTARSLGQLIVADVVLTSPLLRAKQTAEILARQWTAVSAQECEPLGSGSRVHFEEALSRLTNAKVVAAVGHEPSLSDWVSDWLGASRGEAFAFKKGGAALLDFDGEVGKDSGELVFFMGPKTIKDLST